MNNTNLRSRFFSRLTWGLLLVGLLFVTTPLCAEDPVVDTAEPPEAEQETYDLEVTVTGENFGSDSEVDFFIHDTKDPGGIKVKNVKRKNPKILKVTIDVAPDAQTEMKFDIEVRSNGRTGKGTELFRVLEKELPNPKVEWVVDLPDEATAAGNDCIQHLFNTPEYGQQTQGDCNLYASPLTESGWVRFTNSGGNEVDVIINQDPQTGESHTIFKLTVTETERIGFRNLGFRGCRTMCVCDDDGNCDCGGPCSCQVLPVEGSPGPKACLEADCSHRTTPSSTDPLVPYGGDYWVTQNFMESTRHPTAGYDQFGLWFAVDADIDSLPDGPTTFADVYLWGLNLWNTDEVMEVGDEFDHNVVYAYWIDLEDVVIERSGEDVWTVTVNQCGWPGEDGCPPSNIEGQTTRPMVFWETYYQGILTPIGKSGKFTLDSEYRWAIGAGTPFKFITTWRRITTQ